MNDKLAMLTLGAALEERDKQKVRAEKAERERDEAQAVCVDLEHEIRLVQGSLDRPVGHEWKPLVEEVADRLALEKAEAKLTRVEALVESFRHDGAITMDNVLVQEVAEECETAAYLYKYAADELEAALKEPE